MESRNLAGFGNTRLQHAGRFSGDSPTATRNRLKTKSTNHIKITHIRQNQWMNEWTALVSRARHLSTADLSPETHIGFQTISQWQNENRKTTTRGICGTARKTPTVAGECCIAEIWVIAMRNCLQHSWRASKQRRSSSSGGGSGDFQYWSDWNAV